MSEYLNKFRDVAQKAGVQATAFAQTTSRQVQEQAKLANAGFSLPKECERAAKILQSFLADPDHPDSALNAIPKAVLQNAKGLAVFSVVKAGFIWSGKAGSGVVIARLEDGSWSAPSCIATGGIGFGLQIGVDLSEFVVIMNSVEAVRAFTLKGNMTIGGNLSAAAGPIGTGGSIQSGMAHPAPMFSYCRSKGLYAGMSLEGTALVERADANEAFYGQKVPAAHLLTGIIPAPEAATAMYEIIEAAEQVDESSLPQASYIPSQQPGGQPAPVNAYNLSSEAAAKQSPTTGNNTQGEKNNTVFDA